MKARNPSKTMGRPRSFDCARALDRALQVFWRKGYEGASLSDLTKAMGINRPSLYSAFGDKEALFRKVLDRYFEGPASYLHDALKEPTARAVVERLFREALDVQTGKNNPPGCLLIHGALVCGDEARPIRMELGLRRTQGEVAIRRRLERAKSEGDLAANSNPADLARYVATVIQGMAVQAAGGASRKQLQRVITSALHAWPA
jgi:AcrR family transcriptional regulator